MVCNGKYLMSKLKFSILTLRCCQDFSPVTGIKISAIYFLSSPIPNVICLSPEQAFVASSSSQIGLWLSDSFPVRIPHLKSDDEKKDFIVGS